MKILFLTFLTFFLLTENNGVYSQILFDEPFDEPNGSVAGIDNAGGVAWTATCTSCLAGDWYEVQGGVLEGSDTNGPASWETGVIDISSCPYIEINFSLAESGTMEACGTGCNSVDWVQLEYNIDATGWQTPSNSFFCAGACADVDVIQADDIASGAMLYTTGCFPGGTTLQIRITVQTWASDEIWTVDNVTVQCSSGPTVDAGMDQTVCEGDNVTLTASNPDGASISWDNGITDGVAFTPSLGTTTYTVTADLSGCINSDMVDVIVNPGPSFTLSSTDPTTCTGAPDGAITISGLDPGSTYDITYFFGSSVGPTSYVANGSGNITLTGLDVGSYTDFLVDSSGCSTLDQSVINLVAPNTPGVDAGVDQVVCEGDQVTLTAANPDGANISWDNGINDGVAFTPSLGITTYTVTATDPVSGCMNTDQVDVTVNPIPTVSVSPAGPFQTTSGVQTLSASPAGGTWTADCGACINPSTGQFDPAVAGIGTWQVCYTAGTAPCDDQDCISIQVTNDCILSGTVSSSNPTCFEFSDGSVTINISGQTGVPVFTITDSAGTQVNTGNSNTANNLSEGWYYFHVIDDAACEVIDSVFIDDPGQLMIDLEINNPTCWGESTGLAFVDSVYNFTGSYNQISYFWNPNPSGSNGIGEDSLINITQGAYNLQINDQNGCSESWDFYIDWPDSLYFEEIGYEPAYCRLYYYQSGNGVVFASAGGGTGDYDYQWIDLSDSTTSPNTTWGGLNPADYEMTVTDDNGCTLVQVVTVDSLNPLADFELTSDQFIEEYEGTAPVEVHFTNQSQYFANPNNPNADTTFFWNFNTPEPPTSGWIITHDYYEEYDTTYEHGGVYNVCLVAINKNGCTDTSCVEIVVHDPLHFVPVNVFTPNGDGINDEFTFNYLAQSVVEFECVIVNRWGNVVKEMSHITDTWDGTGLNGKKCTEGVYFYKYIGRSADGQDFKGQGNVHLVGSN